MTFAFDYLTLIMVFLSAGIGAVIKHMYPNFIVPAVTKDESVEEIIRRVCKQETVDADLAVKVARCESGLNPRAINHNQDGSYDHGIFQINDKYHPEVTLDQAMDPEFSTHFFCTAFKNGNLSWWNASKTCWSA